MQGDITLLQLQIMELEIQCSQWIKLNVHVRWNQIIVNINKQQEAFKQVVECIEKQLKTEVFHLIL